VIKKSRLMLHPPSIFLCILEFAQSRRKARLREI
jgi:hypothetical protein